MAEKQMKKKKNPAGKILLVLVLVLLAVAALVLFSVKKEISGGVKNGTVQTVEIAQGSGTSKIANRLKEAGLIRYPQLFRWYAGHANMASKLQYGTFEIEEGSSYDEMLSILSKTVAADSVRLTFPEGSTSQAIAAKMEEAGLCTAEEFLDVACNEDFSQYKFWQYVPTDEQAPNRFLKCEGYLFPDTYDFLADDTVYNYVATFYAHFDKMFTDEMYADMEAKDMTLNEVITLASFVQEEAGNENDAKVSAVFHNRLAPGALVSKLESNASSYIQNDADNNYLWNWVRHYYGETWESIPENIRKAYDTYAVAGLTPGAISNPGIDAIDAALHPDEAYVADKYYFFVTDKAGTYYYGHNASEHSANCDKAWAVNKKLAAN